MSPPKLAPGKLDALQRETFAYFVHEVNPANGLIADKTQEGTPASIAAVGLALAAYPVGVERGFLSRAEAAERTLATLRFFRESPQGKAADATGYKGFYYHFLDMKTGKRVWKCELSTVDSAFLLAGMLAAAAYFTADSEDEHEIRTLADKLYRRADWRWAQDGGATVTHGWNPEGGFLPYRWQGYDEALLLYLLGLGSPTHPLPAESYAAWASTYQWRTVYDHEFLYAGPLFTHQLSHVWVDFRGIQDDFMRGKCIDYFENSRRADYAQQQYAVHNPGQFEGYGENCWGITASDGPGWVTRRIKGKERRFFDYLARGVPDGPDDGTIAPCFGFPGDGINGIFEALRTRQDKIKFIQVRHEEAAAFAACGHAKYTGRLGVCLATSGPGGVHLLNGLYDAKCDGQPVLAITGHTFHDLINTNYQQDVDLVKFFMDVSVYSERIMGPAHVPNVVDEAVKNALSRRSVAHFSIPKDIQEWTANDVPRSGANIAKHSADVFTAASPLPASALLGQAANLINAGAKVAILAGRGCLNARKEVLELAEKVGGPIIKPLLGKGVVPDDSPYTTGGIGLLGTAPSQDAMQECDTLIIAGSGFPYMEFYPKPGKAKCVQIDIDATRIGLRFPADVGLVGECRRVLEALLPLVKPKKDRRFVEKAQEGMKQWNKLMEERGTRKDKPMKPQVVTYHLNKLLDKDAIVTADCGTVTTWTARYIQMRDDMKFSASGLLATMGNGLPYSVAAAVAYPGRQVVCVCGDGGFTMMMMEMATLVKYKLPVKVIIIKNNVLGQIKWEQMIMEGNPQFGVQLQPIDFALYAKACGAAGYTLADPEQAEPVLREALAQPGPALVECVVDANEPPMPGHATLKQALGFAEALVRGQRDRWDIIKTVLKDKIREVV